MKRCPGSQQSKHQLECTGITRLKTQAVSWLFWLASGRFEPRWCMYRYLTFNRHHIYAILWESDNAPRLNARKFHIFVAAAIRFLFLWPYSHWMPRRPGLSLNRRKMKRVDWRIQQRFGVCSRANHMYICLLGNTRWIEADDSKHYGPSPWYSVQVPPQKRTVPTCLFHFVLLGDRRGYSVLSWELC